MLSQSDFRIGHHTGTAYSKSGRIKVK
jgi:hypothetical protein